ncbi:acyl-CoA dehydrogenase family protein [Micromonospora sp. CA-248089]|uniref:acyl-CoA dehydrogenase family protein n=1 Tax=Micromonospora sp. CA-248089 TaxID=3239960 RepID=UPI003D928A94
METSIDVDEGHERFRRSVRDRLADPELRRELAALRAGGQPEPDAREVYRHLGRLRLLAPNWPEEYGGDGLGHSAAAIVYEELVRADVPDTLHVNTIQIVALFLLLAGSPEQKAAHLPAMARGERFASVLYTEPEAGSDLGGLRTTATRDGDGWRLDGVKVFSLKSDITDLGLCAARTGSGAGRYDGITLFLVDLHADGVARSRIPSIADEQFHRVELTGVRVGPDAVLGEVGQGWPLLSQALAIERTGLDYTLKAERWYEAAVAGLGHDDSPAEAALLVDAGRFDARLAASRALAWSVLTRLEATDTADEAATAVAKLYSSELAQEVAGWAVGVHGLGYHPAVLGRRRADVLEAAYREAPGLTFSAGASEVMLQIIANLALDDPDPAAGGPADPMRDRLRQVMRGRLARVPVHASGADPQAAWDAVRRGGACTLDVPVAAGGMELGLGAAVVVAEELGRAAAVTPYPAVAAAIDAALAGGASEDMLAELVAGAVPADMGGFDPVSVTAAPDGDGAWKASGAIPVDGTDVAVLLPVAVEDGTALALLPAGSTVPSAEIPGVTDAAGVRIPGERLLCRDVALDDCPEGVVGRARIRQAALLLGLAQGALGEAVRHTGAREQFGRRLRDFQSVEFALAGAYAEVAALRLLVEQAAELADADRPFGVAGTRALALAAETTLEVTRLAMHVCGARGLTPQLRVAPYYLRGRSEAVRLGRPVALWHELGARAVARSRRDDSGGAAADAAPGAGAD